MDNFDLRKYLAEGRLFKEAIDYSSIKGEMKKIYDIDVDLDTIKDFVISYNDSEGMDVFDTTEREDFYLYLKDEDRLLKENIDEGRMKDPSRSIKMGKYPQVSSDTPVPMNVKYLTTNGEKLTMKVQAKNRKEAVDAVKSKDPNFKAEIKTDFVYDKDGNKLLKENKYDIDDPNSPLGQLNDNDQDVAILNNMTKKYGKDVVLMWMSSGEYGDREYFEEGRLFKEEQSPDDREPENLKLDADYDKGGKYYSEEGAEAFRIQPFKLNDIEYTQNQAVRQGKYIVGLKGEELKKFISDYMAAWKEDKGDTPEGKTFK